jgi:hypothetical protein
MDSPIVATRDSNMMETPFHIRLKLEGPDLIFVVGVTAAMIASYP